MAAHAEEGSNRKFAFKPVVLDAAAAADPYSTDLWETLRTNPLVAAFPALGWVVPEGSAGTDTLHITPDAVHLVLLPGCRRATTREAKEAVASADVLTTDLDPEHAGRVNRQLYQWGLLGKSYRSISAYWNVASEFLKNVADDDLGPLMLDEQGCLQDSEPFNAASGGSGRSGGAPAAGPLELEWLHSCPWSVLYRQGDALPFLDLARVKALLGSTQRRVTRAEAMSDCRTSAAFLTMWCCTYMKQDPGSVQPGVLIRTLPFFLNQCHLPVVVQSPFMTSSQVLDDYIDGARWHSEPGSRSDIESKRLVHAIREDNCPKLGKIVKRFDTCEEALPHVINLVNRVLPTQAGRPLFIGYSEIEKYLQIRDTMLALLLQSDSIQSGVDLVNAIITDYETTRLAGGGGSSAMASNGAGSDGAGAGATGESAASLSSTLREVELNQAVHEGKFQLAIRRAEGKTGVDMLEELFMAKSTLMTRFFMLSPSWLRERVPIFGAGGMWLHERQAYFAKVLVLDMATGEVPESLKLYTWSDKQCALWLKFKLREMNVIDPEEGGALKIDSLRKASQFKRVSKYFHYTVEPMLRKACDFFHRLLVSIGTPESVPEGVGFTMKTLCEFQIRYVDMATSLPPQEKNEWLNYGYETFVEHALGKIEELMLARLGSSRPSSREASIADNPILDWDSSYRQRLAAKMQHAESLVLMRNSFPTMFKPEKVDVLAPPKKPSTQSGTAGPGTSALVNVELSEDDDDFSDHENGKGKGKSKKKPRTEAFKEKEKKRKSAKKQKLATDKATAKAASDVPGGKVHLTKRLADQKLFIAGFVYDTKQIAKDFKLDHKSKCWHVLLSKKTGPAALALCPQHTSHGDINADVHTPPAGWVLADVHAKYGIRATTAQAAEAKWVTVQRK